MPENFTVISREQILEKLAEIDALLDIMALHNENELLAEREHLVWLLKD